VESAFRRRLCQTEKGPQETIENLQRVVFEQKVSTQMAMRLNSFVEGGAG
jgi:hypothetical protein